MTDEIRSRLKQAVLATIENKEDKNYGYTRIQ